jgi:hypothetical protein
MYKSSDPKIVQQIYNALHEKHPGNEIEVEYNYNTKEYTMQVSKNTFKGHPKIPIDVNIRVIYGDSVTGDSPLILRDPITNRIHIETIQDIYTENDSINYPEFKLFDQTIVLEKTFSKTHYQVWSDKGWNPIKKVIRHKTNKNIYKITTHTGIVKVTEDHSLLDESGKILKPTECNLDTKLLTSYPSQNILSSFVSNIPLIENESICDTVPINILNGTKKNIDAFIKSVTNLTFTNQLKCTCVYFLLKKLGYNTSLKTSGDYIEILNESDIFPNQIKSIEKQNLGEIYVYDLETESGTFNAGVGDIIVKNTDSVFLSMKYNLDDFEKNRKDSFKLGLLCGDKLTNEVFKRPPIELEFEKVFQPFILLTKKRYIGKKYEDLQDPFKLKMIDFKGLAILRRDYCHLVKKCYKKLIDVIMSDSPDRLSICIKHYKETIYRIEKYDVETPDVLMTASIGKDYACKNCRIKSDWIIKCKKCGTNNPDKLPKCIKCETEFSCLHTFSLAHINLAQSMTKRREEVVVGDRIPFLYKECNDTSIPKNELAETPSYCLENNLAFNRKIYLEQLAKTILPFFKIVLKEEPKLLDDTIDFTNEMMIEFGGKKLKASDYKPIED